MTPCIDQNYIKNNVNKKKKRKQNIKKQFNFGENEFLKNLMKTFSNIGVQV